MRSLFLCFIMVIIGCSSKSSDVKSGEVSLSHQKVDLPLDSNQRFEKLLSMLNYSDWDVGKTGRTIYHKNGEIIIDAWGDSYTVHTSVYVNYADVTFLFSKEQLSYINAKASAIITVCQGESDKRRKDKATEALDKVLRE